MSDATPTPRPRLPEVPGCRVTRRGRVMAFDAHVGLGTVRGDDGTELPFHCTAITDGTREIPVGVEVVFLVVPGPVGRFEATSVTPVSGQAPPGAAGRPS